MRLLKESLARVILIPVLAMILMGGVALPGEALVISRHAAPRQSPVPGAASPAQTAGEGRIAFAAGGEIYLINPDGSGLVQLTRNDPGVYNYQPTLSPDGMRVAFGSVWNSGSGIIVVDVDGGGPRRLTTNDLSYDSEPAWSPDGSKIAFVRGFDPTAEGIANLTTCASEIYVVGAQGGLEINLTQGLGGTDPAWSPDGERIAFVSSRRDDASANGQVENYDLYSMASDGGDVRQLTRTEENEAEPAWSPDGKSIAYASNYQRANSECGFAHTGFGSAPATNGPDIYAVSLDGGEAMRLTELGDSLEPAWSPDGAALAFISSRGGLPQLYILYLSDKKASVITSGDAHKSSPSWARAEGGLLGGHR